MGSYEDQVVRDLKRWQIKMTKKPSLTDRFTKGMQTKVNQLIPEKVHGAITFGIRNMVQAVLIGSEYSTKKSYVNFNTLEEREEAFQKELSFYKKTAATTGAGTGAGGILLGLADFPILLGIKIKFLFNVATLYGFDVSDFRERVYILYLFQLAFSSQEKRNQVFSNILDWDERIEEVPKSMELFDWRTFQQEYRDYIDLVKLLQLVPGIGAVVGAYANYKLLDKLGETAMNGYRMRLLRGSF
jgi:hypothetical protein